MAEVERYDWPKIIGEIPLSHYKISVMVGVQRNQIKRWAAGIGRGPLHYEGQKIISLHAEYVSRETV